jgi:hypothetical protein
MKNLEQIAREKATLGRLLDECLERSFDADTDIMYGALQALLWVTEDGDAPSKRHKIMAMASAKIGRPLGM